MTVAERTRRAVRARPFLHDALRAGVLNYTATARFLDVGDVDAVAAALRRYAEELPAIQPAGAGKTASVRMAGGYGHGEPTEAVLVVGDTALVPDRGSLTVVLATGDVDAELLGETLGRLSLVDVQVEAAGFGGDVLCVAVPRRDGPDALRTVEAAIEND